MWQYFLRKNKFLLVTTSVSFLKVNIKTYEVSVIHRGYGLYYGITKAKNYYMVAARRRMVSSDIPMDAERGVILLFNNKLEKVDEIEAPFPLRDMHEIKWFDNKLWVTCSYDNMIAILEGKNWKRWYPLGEPIEEPFDKNHFNSFYFQVNSIWILAHNKGDSELLEFDLKTLELKSKISLGKQAHNIWKDGEVFYTCSSAESKLVGTNGWELFTNGFPRGIAFSKKKIFVGVSEFEERKKRDYTTGKILIFKRDWELEKVLSIENEGLILDLFLYK